MSKFMSPPGPIRARLSLTGRGARSAETCLRLRLLEELFHSWGVDVRGRKLQEALVCRDGGFVVACCLRRLSELVLDADVIRGQGSQLLVGGLGVLLGALVVREGCLLLRRRLLLDHGCDRVLKALRVAEDLPDHGRGGRCKGCIRRRRGCFELRILVVGGVVAGEDPVLRCELRVSGLVLRLQCRVALERADRLLRALLLLVGGRQVAPRRRVLRILVDLLLQAADRGAAATRAAAEGALEDVAEPVRAGADTEQHEAEDERDGEEDVGPLGVVAEPREEQLLLPLGRLRLLVGRSYRCGPSILRRTALAVLRTSRHCVCSSLL